MSWRSRVGSVAGFGVIAGVAGAAIAEPIQSLDPERYESRRLQPADPVDTLMSTHHCWAGEAPLDRRGVVPGHAVFTLPGAEPRLGDSRVGFDIWLEGKPGRLHGFCP